MCLNFKKQATQAYILEAARSGCSLVMVPVCAVQDILYMLGDHLLLCLQSVILALQNCSTSVDVH